MITTAQYFGEFLEHRDALDVYKKNADALLEKVNALIFTYERSGGKVPVNPLTGCQISGTRYGGFRPQDCSQGAPQSSHKTGRGVDVYDPQGKFDAWITDEILEAFGLYREHPDDTHGWVHLTDRAPGSGRRTFQP